MVRAAEVTEVLREVFIAETAVMLAAETAVMLAAGALRKTIAAGSQVRAKSAIARRKIKTAESSISEGSSEHQRQRSRGRTDYARKNNIAAQ